MKRHWKLIAIAAAVAVTGLSVVAVATGAAKSRNPQRGTAACGKLMSNPDALKDMQALRVEHQGEMQAWYDKYGADRTSAAAKAALQKLRAEHWADMRDLFKKYGIDAPEGASPGACGGAGGGMMGRGQGSGGCFGTAGTGGSGTGPGNGRGMMGGGNGGGMMGGQSY